MLWVVLFRGINVGGNNLVPMKSLAEMLNKLGGEQVKTYIQSGNVVLQHAETDSEILSTMIADAVENEFGFKPRILLLKVDELIDAADNNPYPQAEVEPKSLHLFFLTENPTCPDLEALNGFKKDNESFTLIGNVFYLHAPDGVGRSKLVEKVEKCLAVPTTARNWNTVNKLIALIDK